MIGGGDPLDYLENNGDRYLLFLPWIVYVLIARWYVSLGSSSGQLLSSLTSGLIMFCANHKV